MSYLKNQIVYHDGANNAINVHFMSSNLLKLKQLLHAVSRSDNFTFRGVPKFEGVIHFLQPINLIK